MIVSVSNKYLQKKKCWEDSRETKIGHELMDVVKN